MYLKPEVDTKVKKMLEQLKKLHELKRKSKEVKITK